LVAQLQHFKDVQRLAYDCVIAVEKKLAPGITEREAAALLAVDLRARGVKDMFHTPFAWFGDRTRLDGMSPRFKAALPSERKLKESDVVILDVAPIVQGCIGDIGYTCSLMKNPELDRARSFLLELRVKILEWFNSPCALGEIWDEVDREVSRHGFTNCHALYPHAVLGHRIVPVRERQRFGPSVPISHLSWFGLTAYRLFIRNGILPVLLRRKSHGSKEGIWAIEPHIGGRGFGAKFEEMLVVTDGKARWLDDELPHVLTGKSAQARSTS
jgi:Xaa-Pro aminopeptidase